MKKNYKFILTYDGTKYYGWEHQPKIDETIQGKIENVLSKMSEEDIEVIGCGRTDAGVSAKGYVCNARLDESFDPNYVRDYLNRYLPDNICVDSCIIASDRFHSRYNAVGKTYRYTCYIGDTKPVFDRKYVYALEFKPDIEAMKAAAAILIGEHDFASFCSNPKMKKSTVRRVDSIDIKVDGDYLTFTYHGSGFLQHMVRIMTGTLLEVGEGKRDASSMRELIEAKERAKAGACAPAQGLCLIKVDY
ncbi:MAG: tRNA pseudouridine(38-40) synthase TruA [Lachnospiraceae bacterium]|nr:tRNA pseudouridine(38-40) synthase TruA [Lachnospiraceae bacterium]MBP5565156.1 tRNA pseudouridine(38-40) synthase TruA [Lachnospiraceae bacterium]